MTRKEAIKWLNKLYARADITDEYGDIEDMQPYEEAINIAINSLEIDERYELEYEQAEPKTDVLNKIKAIVGEWVVGAETDYFTYKCMRKIVDVIMESEDKK